MPVINSILTQDDHPQIDGSYWFTETHTLADSSVQKFTYLANPKTVNTAAIMANRVVSINADEAYANDPARFQEAINIKQALVDQTTGEINAVVTAATAKGVVVTVPATVATASIKVG